MSQYLGQSLILQLLYFHIVYTHLRRLQMSRLIWIHNVCHVGLDLRLIPLLVTMAKSKRIKQLMHHAVICSPCPIGPENSGAFIIFFFFNFQIPAKHPAQRRQIYGKIPAKSPFTRGRFCILEQSALCCKNQPVSEDLLRRNSW